jgi:hypothetical protein
MSLGKLNYESLNEEFCYWYHKVNGKFPSKSTNFSKLNLVVQIHKLKRINKVVEENSSPYQPQLESQS